jgi:APA family basic amino acid/polyamine antiporter
MHSEPEKPAAKLVRALGPFTAMAVVVGTVIGSGVFKKPQTVAEHVPFFGLAASVWILGGVLALLGALSLAEVAVLFPRAGGNYVFLREGYGRLAGFLWGWVDFWIIRGASLAALATVFSESLYDLLGIPRPLSDSGFWVQKGLTVAVIMGLALVNVRGVRWGGVLQLVITLVKMGSLLGIMVLPLVALHLASSNPQAAKPDLGHLAPLFAGDTPLDHRFWAGYGTALVGVLFAYHGWNNIVPVAEEVQKPQRNLPLALLGGVGVVIFLYLGANFAYYVMMPRDEIAAAKDTTVATAFALKILGPAGGVAASAAVMMSVFGALNGNLLVGPRLLYAMGEDRLAPRSFSAIHEDYRTPAVAILITGAWASILVLLGAALMHTRLPTISFGDLGTLDVNVPANKSLFDILTDFAMFGAVMFETAGVATIFVFRRRLPHAERPYRCIGYPVVPALYILIMAMVLANMFMEQQTESLCGVAFIALGAAVYWLAAPRSRNPQPEEVPVSV